MRVILDECLPRRLSREISGHQVVTVQGAGFSGLKNGELLRRIEGNFDVFLTIDGNLGHQQNISRFELAVVALRAVSNRIEDLRPLLPAIQNALSLAKPGSIVFIPE